jgi:hypothetical protein
MKKLLTGVCVLALGAGVLAGCTERSDRVGGTDRDRTTSPSASPGTRPGDSTTTTTPPPGSSTPSSSGTDSTKTTK